MNGYEFLMANPEYAAVFFQGMGSISSAETESLLTAYDFSQYREIVDFGGGRGTLLAAILKQASGSHGILYDSPYSTADALPVMEEAGVAARCTIQNGGIFDSPPAGADAYVLKHIVHDFPESECLAVLKNIRSVINPDGKLLVMEYVLKGNNERHIGNVIDLWLLLLLGARERTRQQYSDLFARAGFKLTAVVSTSSPISIVEAVPD
jgi:O-methyltransferase